MMAQLNLSNWIGFGSWLLAGLVIYFGYGFKKQEVEVRRQNV
jgi:hypothetical protein